MKNQNQLQQKIVEFIKNADVYLDNFEYVDMNQIKKVMEHVTVENYPKYVSKSGWIGDRWFGYGK